MIDDKDIYAAIVQNVTNAEQVSWNRFNNFLMSNSIFVLAWATLYAADSTPRYSKAILSTLCLIGLLSSVVWAGLGYRGRKNVNRFLSLGNKIETDKSRTPPELATLGPCANARALRDTLPCRWAGSFLILIFGPLVFGILYVWLLWPSLYG